MTDAAPVIPIRRDRCGRALARSGFALALLAVPAAAGPPDRPPPSGLAVLSPGRAYVETDGASLYANVCQGCHMGDGRGAVGAAAYPALAGNADLQSKEYCCRSSSRA